MNLLPIAGAPANVAVTDPATYTSGDFTALLAMLVGVASTTLPIDGPPGEPGGPVPDSGFLAPEPGVPVAPGFPAIDPGTSGPAADVAAPPAAELPEGSAPLGTATIPAPRSAPAGSSATGAERRAEQDPQLRSAVSDRPLAEAPIRPVPDTPVRPAADGPVGPGAENPVGPVAQAPVRPGAVTPSRRTPAAAVEHASEVAVEHARGVPFQAAGPLEQQDGAPVDNSRPVPRPHNLRPDEPPVGESASSPVVPQPRPDRGKSTHDTPPAVPATAVDVPEPLRTDAPPPSGKAEVVPVSKIAVNPKFSEGPAHPAVAPVAAARSEALVPVDAPPPAPVVPASVPEQIVSAVVPLHGRGDGRHEVTLELRPDDLGAIRVEVSVEHQTVHLTLHAAEPATGRLLSAALPELRTALADAGLTAGQVGVGVDGGGGTGHRARPQAPAEGRSPDRSRATAHDPAPVPTPRPAVAGRLDLFL